MKNILKNLALGILFASGFAVFSLSLPASNVSADTIEESPASTIISSEKISPYVLEFKSVPTTFARTAVNSNEVTTVTLDFSEAEFYDEDGQIVNKDAVMETVQPTIQTRGASSSGGSWQTGSGYAVCKGMKVKGNAGKIGLEINYKVDFQNIQKGYDRLDRVYGATADGLGSWSWMSNGVFRAKETAQYSAYGGVKGQWTVAPGLGLPSGTSTKYLYFRVGNDKFWLDHNL